MRAFLCPRVKIAAMNWTTTTHRCSDHHCSLVPVAHRGQGWGTNSGCNCLRELSPNKRRLVEARLDELFAEIEGGEELVDDEGGHVA